MNKNKYQKGISLYLAIIVMAILLTIIIGISAILAKQIKTISGVENSVLALYAADAGVEVVLKDVFLDIDSVSNSYSAVLNNGSDYTVDVVCCPVGGSCVWSAGNPCPFGISSPSCSAYYYCIKSVGSFRGVRRALYINI